MCVCVCVCLMAFSLFYDVISLMFGKFGCICCVSSDGADLN